MTTEVLASIDAPHLYAGIVLSDGTVTETAPILRYMRGWSRDRVRSYCRDKKWRVSVIYERPKDPMPPARTQLSYGCQP